MSGILALALILAVGSTGAVQARSAPERAEVASVSTLPVSTASGRVYTTIPVLRGIASYYSARTGTAAAGPKLRKALGGGRRYLGRTVRVCRGSRCRRVRIVTSCGCPHGRVIDLSRGDFAAFAPLSRGLVTVEIRP